MPKNVFGVFAGGGAKGAAFVGAVQESAHHVKFSGWGGTSAGSIVAALLACGFSPDELRDRLTKTPYSKFFTISMVRLLFFYQFRGLADPAPLLSWIRELIREKFPREEHLTFLHLYEFNNKPLKIVATNVSKRDVEIFSHKHTPGKEVAQAVLASCAFPVLFPPVQDGHFQLVDGGVLSNFPMWLFHDEEELFDEFTPVLGFTLSSKKHDAYSGIFTHFTSIFESLIAAQDRVQEKYLDVVRLSNVIRIDVTGAETFPSSQSRAQQDSLVLAGREAAARYFRSATENYGERVKVFSRGSCPALAKEQLAAGDAVRALSTIARNHLLHGGFARDDGFSGERVIVRYYVNLMEAVTDHGNVEVLATILASFIETLPRQPTRLVGLKRGNSILAYEVGRRLQVPLSIFKTDMSYKMGMPFDGRLERGDVVVLVDDVASDAGMLMNAIRYLSFFKVKIISACVLVERTEGNAADKMMKDRSVELFAICKADDEAIQRLIELDDPLPCGNVNPIFCQQTSQKAPSK